MTRVAGADPGTSSLDLLLLDDGLVIDQRRFSPDELEANPSAPVDWLAERGPYHLIAGPSGYGLPLRHAHACTEQDLALMTLVRPSEQGTAQGILGFSRLLRAFRASSLPVVFLPGVVHLPTVPSHRKINHIDMGTADKLCVAALALHDLSIRLAVPYERCSACLVELGSAFAACVVLSEGRIVDGIGGTAGPIGEMSAGGWDGEAAYLLGPLTKNDLFTGGVLSIPSLEMGQTVFLERMIFTVAGLKAITPFEHIILSGRLLDTKPTLCVNLANELSRFGNVMHLNDLPGARVKQAAQGAALLAEGLAGGRFAGLVDHLQIREANGTSLDGLVHPRAAQVRDDFGLPQN